MLGTSTSTKQEASENSMLLEMSRVSPLIFEETPELISSVAPDTVEGCKKKKKKKKKTKALSEQGPEEPAMEHNQKDGHQLTEHKHKEQTVTELEVVEKGSKKLKKGKQKKQLNVGQDEMGVPDPEEQTSGKTKKKSKNLQTQQVGAEGVTADEKNMNIRKKKRKHNDIEPERGIDCVLSKSAVDVSAVTAPDEARKSKKKHKNRQTELEEGAESRRAISTTAEDPEIIELHTETVKRGESMLTEAEENVKEKRKRKKKKHRESELNDCPEKADLPGIKEQTERKLKSKRLKTDGGSTAVEGSGRKKNHRGESDKGMDSVHSAEGVLDLAVPNDNRTHGAGTNSETEGAHSVMVETGTQHNKPSLKEETLSVDDWQALNDLKEFIPNVESKSVDEIHKMIKYDLDRFREFRRQGLSLRSGKFSTQENERIKSNVYDFLALTGIQSGSKLFHPQRFKEEKANIKQLKRQHKFHEIIGEGIPRPWHQVYIRGRKIFDASNYKGRFTEEELHSLKKLQTLHGNKWATISELTGRSESALEKRFAQMSANRGAWTEEELKRLMEAVRKHLVGQAEPGSGPATVRKDKLYNNIPWADVCQAVETRHCSQCRIKWLAVLKHKMAYGQPVFSGGTTSLQGKVDLIKALSAKQIEDAADIDWEEIAYSIGNVTPRYIQTHYYRLKVASVPLWQSMSFCEIIDFLNSRVLPNFEEQLQALIKSGEMVSRNDPQELFLLSEIFDNEDDA
ncbi:transcription termination factor 1-like [Salvelinus fontinalis]|uniref:transcription termination factor 1-like n=1 Tax=Salvelinus fontinalis TaxID=8038 RepID=UPI002486AE98|nr:transcription termination factor 1-like [Salvelinus fontinalis]XP_055761040.1 transcription termination factor 1-like [Salvelinus fontinalis]XP_055761042.1 transcription termination factor 1-like [Salvelinus fontinalis]